MKCILLSPLVAVALFVQPAAGVVRYVKQDAAGNNTGSSWTNAYRDLRTALNAAVSGDHVWIAAGIYYADYDAATDTRTGDRSLRFPLKSQLTVLGGFAGTETIAAQRDWHTNRTILNGEAGSPDLSTDNTMTIMGTPGILSGVVIDGLVFANGYADDPREGGSGDLVGGNGGALFLGGEATVRHCTFLNNYAIYGGAIKVPGGSTQLRVEQCLFVSNRALYVGGAIDFHAWQQALILTHCTLLHNFAPRGSAIGTNGGPVAYRGNVFFSNAAETGAATSMLEYNLWPMATSGTGNTTYYASPIARSPSQGPDNLWGTADDYLDAPLRADSPAVNLSTVVALPRDTGDTDGDGAVNEPAPFDAARFSRINDGLPDAGAFEMVNVAPANIMLASAGVIEASPADAIAGSLSADDENAGVHVFALVPGSGDEGNAAFTILNTQLRAGQTFDYETKSSYSVRVRATDSMGLWVEKAFVVPIINRTDQTVWIETLKAGGTEPLGGVSGRTGPGGWPEHWAVAKVRRSGPESQGPLVVLLQGYSTTYGPGDLDDDDAYYGFSTPEYFIHTGSGITFDPYIYQLPVHLEAGQSEMLIGIEPLFDISSSPEPPGTITLTIEDGNANYTVGTPASAMLTIYDSPTAQWSTESGMAADAAGLATFALGNSLSISPAEDGCMMLSALINPVARDVAVTWEQSEDLAVWTNAAPVRIIWPANPGQPAQWCLPAPGSRRFYRPRGVSTQQPMGFGAGVDAAKMVFIPAGAGLTGPVRFLFQHPFWMGKTEVSGDDFQSLDLQMASGFVPATGLPPEQIAIFTQRASERGYYGVIPSGYVLRLPTEAEWIYAASPPYALAPPSPIPLENRAWYLNNAFGVTHSVGTRLPNERGLHDMLGNVSEWTSHRIAPPETGNIADESNLQANAEFAIICGGNIWQGAEAQTATQRAEYPVADPSPLIGFRLVIARPLPAP